MEKINMKNYNNIKTNFIIMHNEVYLFFIIN